MLKNKILICHKKAIHKNVINQKGGQYAINRKSDLYAINRSTQTDSHLLHIILLEYFNYFSSPFSVVLTIQLVTLLQVVRLICSLSRRSMSSREYLSRLCYRWLGWYVPCRGGACHLGNIYHDFVTGGWVDMFHVAEEHVISGIFIMTLLQVVGLICSMSRWSMSSRQYLSWLCYRWSGWYVPCRGGACHLGNIYQTRSRGLTCWQEWYPQDWRQDIAGGYRKIPKYLHTRKTAVIILKFEQRVSTIE